MDKIELEIIGLTQYQENSYSLVLAEMDGKRRLSIIIGHYEAQVIALGMEKMKPSRPLTHELLFNIANIFDIKLYEVRISKFKDGIFEASLMCDNGQDEREIDSRTSDAVALSLLFKCPIYTTEEVLSEAGVVYEEEKPFEKPTNVDKTIEELTLKELSESLQQSIEDEDYEKSSVIRDEINKRK